MKAVSHYLAWCILTVVLFGCDSGSKGQIERVLKADKKVGDELLVLVPKGAPSDGDLALYALAIQGSVKQQREISLSGCPTEFVTAYVDHVRAWEDFGETLRNRPQIPSGFEALLGGFIRGMMGDITGGAGEIDATIRSWVGRLQEAEQRIKTSWRTVEDVAIQHGAQLP